MSARPERVTIDGREYHDRDEVDAFIAELELMIGRLRRKLDESYYRAGSA
jgi:hypothetical protein